MTRDIDKFNTVCESVLHDIFKTKNKSKLISTNESLLNMNSKNVASLMNAHFKRRHYNDAYELLWNSVGDYSTALHNNKIEVNNSELELRKNNFEAAYKIFIHYIKNDESLLQQCNSPSYRSVNSIQKLGQEIHNTLHPTENAENDDPDEYAERDSLNNDEYQSRINKNRPTIGPGHPNYEE